MNATRTQRGFTIVEILVAVTISLFLLAGVLQVFVGSKQAYRMNEALGRMQESGRFALDIIARDVRLAGFSATREICGGDPRFTLESNPSTNEEALEGGRIRVALECFTDGELDPTIDGCEEVDDMSGGFGGITDAVLGYNALDGGGWSPALPGAITGLGPTPETDVVTIARSSTSDGAGDIRIIDHSGGNPPGSADVKVLDSDVVLEEGEIVMVVDENCETGSIFQISQINENKGEGAEYNRNLVHNTGGGDAPGNRTNRLGKDYTGGFLVGAGPAELVTYYLDTGESGLPALFRSTDGAAGEELVDGVEDMQIEYSTGDGKYYNAAEITDKKIDWEDVVAVRISLLVQSPEANLTAEGEDQYLKYNDAAVDTTDRRLRQVFTTTVALRNRLP